MAKAGAYYSHCYDSSAGGITEIAARVEWGVCLRSEGDVCFLRTSGRDLGAFPDSIFDLVCAVDSFPYLFIAGLADLHVHEAARVLKPGGNLIVLNYSYRGDEDADRADILRLARDLGLTVRRNGTRDFELWDGISFLLQKSRERNGT